MLLSLIIDRTRVQARVFRVYSSWILAMLLGHQNLQLMAFPEVLFSAAEYTLTGQANCAHDKVPLVGPSTSFSQHCVISLVYRKTPAIFYESKTVQR